MPCAFKGIGEKYEYVSSSVDFNIQGLWRDYPGSPHSTDRFVFVGATQAPRTRVEQINFAGVYLQAM